jgi:hypothetical protein
MASSTSPTRWAAELPPAPTWAGRSAGTDARAVGGEISRGAEVAPVVIEISGKVWSADPLSLPDDTQHVLETDGRAELLKVLAQDDLPRVIRCGSWGCSYLSASDAGERTTRT